MFRSVPILLAFFIVPYATAQDDGDKVWQGRSSTLGGGVEFGIPLGEFAHTWGQGTFGLSANVAFPMRLLPLELGYDFGWGRMGGEYSLDQAPGNLLGATTGRKVEVNSNIYGHHGLLRLNPARGQVRPYADLMLGVRQFVTRSVMTSEDGNTTDERDSGVVSSYGWAAGVMVGISRNIYLEGRVERLFSGEISYVDPSSIEIAGDGSVTYEKLTSRTDAVNIQLGLGFRF